MILTDGRPTIAWLDAERTPSTTVVPKTRAEAEREMRGALVDLVQNVRAGSDNAVEAALRNAEVVLALTEAA